MNRWVLGLLLGLGYVAFSGRGSGTTKPEPPDSSKPDAPEPGTKFAPIPNPVWLVRGQSYAYRPNTTAVAQAMANDTRFDHAGCPPDGSDQKHSSLFFIWRAETGGLVLPEWMRSGFIRRF